MGCNTHHWPPFLMYTLKVHACSRCVWLSCTFTSKIQRSMTRIATHLHVYVGKTKNEYSLFPMSIKHVLNCSSGVCQLPHLATLPTARRLINHMKLDTMRSSQERALLPWLTTWVHSWTHPGVEWRQRVTLSSRFITSEWDLKLN